MRPVYRESPCKKSRLSRGAPPPAGRRVTTGLATARPGHYVLPVTEAAGGTRRMNRSLRAAHRLRRAGRDHPRHRLRRDGRAAALPGLLMAASATAASSRPTAARPGAAAPPPAPFRSGRARRVSLRARLMFLLPLPLLFAGLGAIGRGNAAEMLGELGGFAGLMLVGLAAQRGAARRGGLCRPRRRPAAGDSAQALRRGADRRERRSPAGLLGRGQGAGGGAGLRAWSPRRRSSLAFGLDPMRRKGLEGVDAFATERVARAIDQAEALVRADRRRGGSGSATAGSRAGSTGSATRRARCSAPSSTIRAT